MYNDQTLNNTSCILLRKLIKFVRNMLILLLLICVNLGYAKLEIIIKDTPDWGPMSDADIKILCQNVVDHFEKHLSLQNEIHDKVNVYRTDVGYHFLTLDIVDPNVRYKIGIQPIRHDGIGYRITDFFYLIQPFTHEFCHILQDATKELFVKDADFPNLWFMEGIATMSSVWLLRELSKEWMNGSHFGVDHHDPNGAVYNFSQSFDFWANELLHNTPRFQFDGTAKQWLEKYEDNMRETSLKLHNGDWGNVPPEQLTFKFLPIFEKNPQAWNIVTKMPFTKGKMTDYIQDWYDAVDIQDKQYVEAIAYEMGITVIQHKTADIDADVNNDGYIDLYDVMIVRSAITHPTTYDTDVNNDGVTDEVDLWIVKGKAMEAIALAAPSISSNNKLTTKWASLKKR